LKGQVASSFCRVAAMNSPIVSTVIFEGDLARRVPAHPVGHDEEAFGDVHRRRVLVVLALRPTSVRP
jgi:hypothetical protein